MERKRLRHFYWDQKKRAKEKKEASKGEKKTDEKIQIKCMALKKFSISTVFLPLFPHFHLVFSPTEIQAAQKFGAQWNVCVIVCIFTPLDKMKLFAAFADKSFHMRDKCACVCWAIWYFCTSLCLLLKIKG